MIIILLSLTYDVKKVYILKCNRLQLKIPTLEDLKYRKQLLLDPDTMNYNKGFEKFCGYNRDTGCIDFNEDKWINWFNQWINNVPERYYAYIIKMDENIPIGEVALRYVKDKEAYCVNIIIEEKYRGNGYSEEALCLLIDIAFQEFDAKKVFDDFPETRVSAEKVFQKLGFKRISKNIIELTQNDYINFKMLS